MEQKSTLVSAADDTVHLVRPARKPEAAPESYGYRRGSYWIGELFNISGALLLLLMSSPVFLLVLVLVLIREGRPIFYRGIRLGKDKETFYMFKFRTLVRDAEQQLQHQLVGKRCDLVTRTGKFLRDTRLDELPQLYNVLRRDMDLVGPRPVRPAVYDKICTEIPNYDRRFEVRPGLVGFSQIFTPHSTPKEIRSLIDNRLIRKNESVWWNIQALFLTGVLLLRTIIVRLYGFVRDRLYYQLILRRYNEKRRYDRIRTRQARCFIPSHDHQPHELVGEVIDINVEAFLLRATRNINEYFPGKLRLEIYVRKSGRITSKRKLAICNVEVFRVQKLNDTCYEYVLTYDPVSPLNFYMVQQYFLRQSVG